MKQVDLDQQFIIVAGIRIQGFGDGDAATLAFTGPAWIYKKGADGLGTRSKNLDRSALLTLRVMQSSDVNALLSALHNLDWKSVNGAGLGSTMIKDGQGTTLLTGKDSYIEAPPDITIAAAASVREWKIRIDHVEGVWGGN